MVSTYQRFRVLSLLFGLGILAVVGWQYSITELLASIQETTHHWSILVLGLIGLYIVRPFLLWPLSAFSVFIGYVFGLPFGVPLVLFGTVLTCLPPFFVATRVDGTYLDWATGYGVTFVDITGELRGMIAARLSPAPADAVSYGAGLAGLSTRIFALGTLIGELPWAVFYVFLGQSLRTFSVAEIQQVDIRLVLLAAITSILLIARPIYGFLRNRVNQVSN